MLFSLKSFKQYRPLSEFKPINSAFSATVTPIKGATITIVELAKTTKTDAPGKYAFKPVEHGKYTVRITAESYQPFENDEIEVKMGDIRHLDWSW
jgi:hypothetical protein